MMKPGLMDAEWAAAFKKAFPCSRACGAGRSLREHASGCAQQRAALAGEVFHAVGRLAADWERRRERLTSHGELLA